MIVADSFEVVDGHLVAVHGGRTVRLSLAVPLERFDAWLELEAGSWWEMHTAVRDRIMPVEAADVVRAEETLDAVFGVELVRRWVAALNERLGKVLSISPFGDRSGQPSPPTSGSGTESEPTEPEPTAPPRSSRSTRKRS